MISLNLNGAINKLIDVKSDRALNFILGRLGDFAFLSDFLSEYLSLYVNRPQTKDKIVEFVGSADNIYEWQEMWLLLSLSKANKLDDCSLGVLRNTALDPGKHWAPRAAAILALGRVGDSTDRSLLKSLYSAVDNYYLKKAILVGTNGLPKAVRNSFYSGIERESYSIGRLVKYIKQDNIDIL